MRIPIIQETGRHMQSLAAAWRRWSRSRETTPSALVSPSCRRSEDAALPTVALLVSSTSRNSGYGPPEDYQLLKGRLRSFLNNASGRTEIRLLVAYDRGDRWFEMHHQELQRLCMRQFQDVARRVSVVPQEAVQIRCVDNPSGSNPVYAWNALFQHAHEQRVDYCIQLGDDIECLTRDWDVKLIQALRRSGNWGLAGGWNGNDDIITQAFVHTASHMQLFGSLYPSSLRNWGSDTWIDHVYRSVPGLRHWLRDDVQMLNGVTASPGLNSNRYQIATDWETTLAAAREDGRDRIGRHFASVHAMPVACVCSTATRDDLPSLDLFARSLRLFEPDLPLLVGTDVRSEDFLRSWCESRPELAVRVLPAAASKGGPAVCPPLGRRLQPALATASRALAAYENSLHLGVRSLFTAPLTEIPRWGTVGLLPRFLRSEHLRSGTFYEPQCLFLARPRPSQATGAGDATDEPSWISFELPESCNVSAERLQKGCHEPNAFRGGAGLTYNGLQVRTVEAPFAASRSSHEAEFVRRCLENLALCEAPALSRLSELLGGGNQRRKRVA